jgi:hypothetical protein
MTVGDSLSSLISKREKQGRENVAQGDEIVRG